jgi:hypothetical protein
MNDTPEFPPATNGEPAHVDIEMKEDPAIEVRRGVRKILDHVQTSQNTAAYKFVAYYSFSATHCLRKCAIATAITNPQSHS